MNDRHIPSKDEAVDSTEQYYAHMESDRNAAEAAYFDARPMIDREGTPVTTFRAGFERAYQLLWNDLQSSRRETDRACQETREALAREVAALRGSPETPVSRSVEGLATYPHGHGDPYPVMPVLGTPLQISDAALANLIKYETHHSEFCAFVELWERRGAVKTSGGTGNG